MADTHPAHHARAPRSLRTRHFGRAPKPFVDSDPSPTNNVTVTTRALERRFDNAKFTFYDAGLGACGKTNKGSDFVSGFGFFREAGVLTPALRADCCHELGCE